MSPVLDFGSDYYGNRHFWAKKPLTRTTSQKPDSESKTPLKKALADIVSGLRYQFQAHNLIGGMFSKLHFPRKNMLIGNINEFHLSSYFARGF